MTSFSRVTQKSLLHFGVRLLLCNSASVFYSEATIVDILLSEISYNMRIVTEMLGYNPLCLGERQREREKGKEEGGEEEAERRVWQKHKRRAKGVIIRTQYLNLLCFLIALLLVLVLFFSLLYYKILWLRQHEFSSDKYVSGLEFPST